MKKFDTYIYFYVILTSMLLIFARSGSIPPLLIYLVLLINLVLIIIRIFLGNNNSNISNLKKWNKFTLKIIKTY